MATISTRGTDPRLPTGDDEPVDDERQASVPIVLRLLFVSPFSCSLPGTQT